VQNPRVSGSRCPPSSIVNVPLGFPSSFPTSTTAEPSKSTQSLLTACFDSVRGYEINAPTATSTPGRSAQYSKTSSRCNHFSRATPPRRAMSLQWPRHASRLLRRPSPTLNRRQGDGRSLCPSRLQGRRGGQRLFPRQALLIAPPRGWN